MRGVGIRDKWPVIAVLSAIFAAMWLINRLTPWFVDDWYYSYVFIDGAFDMDRPITSLTDVLVSQYNHYFKYNGRLPVHIMVQIFNGLTGKGVFNVINAAVFTLFVYLLTRMTSKTNAVSVLFVCGVVFLLYPEFGITMLWMSGAVNYLWTSVVVCMFVILFEHLCTEQLCPKHIWLAIPSLLAGWSHEGVALPLAASLGLYVLVNRKNICRQAVLPMIAGFVAGALLCAFSPATLGRAGNTASLYMKVSMGIRVLLMMKALWVLLFTLAVLRIVKGGRAFGRWFREFYADNGVLCNAVVLSLGVVFVSGMPWRRVGIGAELFSIIMWLRIIGSLKPLTTNICRVACSVAGCLLCAAVIRYSVPNYREWRHILAQLEDDAAEVVVFTDQVPPRLYTYILSPVFGLGYDCISHIDDFIIERFGCRDKVFVSSIIYEDIKIGSDRVQDIHKQGEYPLYVVPIGNRDEVDGLKPVMQLYPADFGSIPFYVRPFASRLSRYTLSEVAVAEPLYDIVEVEGGWYLFVHKNEVIDNRLKDIILK